VCGEFAEFVPNAATLAQTLLVPEAVALPGHVQSHYLQAALKLFAFGMLLLLFVCLWLLWLLLLLLLLSHVIVVLLLSQRARKIRSRLVSSGSCVVCCRRSKPRSISK
jgi:hypothetical protein